MFRVGEISSLMFLSQNVAQISVKHKLDRIIQGCIYLTLSALVMWKNSQALQRTVPMSLFYPQGRVAHGVLLSLGVS